MRKVKRKYTRKVTPETPQDAPELKSRGIKEESSRIPQVDKVTVPVGEFSFDDLPLSLRMQVESIIKWRKAKGLPDDSKERIERAVKYFRGGRLR